MSAPRVSSPGSLFVGTVARTLLPRPTTSPHARGAMLQPVVTMSSSFALGTQRQAWVSFASTVLPTTTLRAFVSGAP